MGEHLPLNKLVRYPWMNLESEDTLEDDCYSNATHTCEYCQKQFQTITGDPLILDLGNCSNAILAAKAGCHFFQRVMWPTCPQDDRIRVCLEIKTYHSEVHVMEDTQLCGWVRFLRLGDLYSGQAESSFLDIWNSLSKIKYKHLEPIYQPNWLKRDKRFFPCYPNVPLFTYFIPNKSHKDLALDRHVRPPNLNPVSENAILHMRSWLGKCYTEHDHSIERAVFASKNEAVGQVALTPKRLLKIDPETGNTKLVSGVAEAKYAILSYCWGGDQKAKMTSSNRQKYEKCISISTLSQTLQDAIKVTTLLGLEYLWIDALCITQDDKSESTSEIARMADVYRGSVVTILAGGASKCHQGFLVPRQMVTDRYQISCKLPDKEIERSLFLEDRIDTSLKELADPVNRRAWIFQESLLSPRLIYFSPQQIIMRCGQKLPLYCPDGGNSDMGITHSLPYFDWKRSELQSRIQSPVIGPIESNSTLDESFKSWGWILRGYSDRGLSDPSDKLPALSATAQIFAKIYMPSVTRAIYSAGLWNDHLPFNLLWRCTKPTLRPAKKKEVKAPTWSWISINGPVTTEDILFLRYSHPRCISVKHIECSADPKEPDFPFGEVTSGHVRLKGLIKEMANYKVQDTRILFTDLDWFEEDDLFENAGFLDTTEFEVKVSSRQKQDFSVSILSIIRWPQDRDEAEFTEAKWNEINGEDSDKDKDKDKDKDGDEGEDSDEDEDDEFDDYSISPIYYFWGLLLMREGSAEKYTRIGYIKMRVKGSDPLDIKDLQDWQKSFEEREITIE